MRDGVQRVRLVESGHWTVRLVDHHGLTADVVDYTWNWQLQVVAQPAHVVRRILKDHAILARDVAQPSRHLLLVEAISVGMSQWNVDSLNLRPRAPSNPHAADVARA